MHSCENPTGQLYSPAECNASQVNYTCAAPVDTCLHARAIHRENETEKEVELKMCVTADSCRHKGNNICNGSEGECYYTCCQQDLCNDDFPNGDQVALRCYHCKEPSGSGTFVFNHSTPLTESFTTSQCAAQQTQMYCPHENRCGRVIRKFQQGNGDEFVVERRSCISVAECDYLKELCNGTRSVGNATSQCWDLCCPHNLCNSASCVKLTLPLIAIATIFGVISV